MTTTGQNLIDTTRRRLRAGIATEDQINILAADYSPGDTTLLFSQPVGPIQGGVRISVGLSTFHVWTPASDGLSATVTTASDGSPLVPLPAGTIVRVKPRWTDFDIFSALNDDIADLSSPSNGLYQVLTSEFTYNAAIRGYDLGGVAITRIMDVRYQTVGPWKDWPRVLNFRLERNADTNDFPSGQALRMDSGAYQGRPVQIVYAAAFTPLADPTVDVATTGLPVTAFRLPPLGAAVQMQLGADIERTRLDTQPSPRRMADIQVGSPGTAIRAIAMLRAQWINSEATRLMAQYPIRMT